MGRELSGRSLVAAGDCARGPALIFDAADPICVVKGAGRRIVRWGHAASRVGEAMCEDASRVGSVMDGDERGGNGRMDGMGGCPNNQFAATGRGDERQTGETPNVRSNK